MAFDAGTAKGTLELDAGKFISSLDRIERSLTALEGDSQQTQKSLDGFVGSLVTLDSVLNLVARAFHAAQAVLAPFARELGEASQSAAEAQAGMQSLAATLALRGARDVEGTTQAIADLGAELQGLGVAADDTVVQVGQVLARFGTGERDLANFTRAVFDFSRIAGIEATQAAELLGRTLDGTIGRLAEYLPAARDLTEEQAKQGGVFELLRTQIDGYAESVGRTSLAIRDQLTNTLDDLRETIGGELNPVLDQARLQLVGIVEGLTAAAANNAPAIRDFFVDSAQTILETAASIVDAFAMTTEAIGVFVSSGQLALPALAGTLAELELQVREFIVAYDEFLNRIGLTSDEALQRARDLLAESRQEVDGLADAYADASRESAKTAAAARELADRARRAADAARSFSDNLEEAREAANGLTPQMVGSASAAASLDARIASAKAILDQAQASAGGLREELEGAADAAADVASAGGDGGDGGGGGGDSGRRSGGSLGLDTSDAFASLESLEIAQRGLRQASFSSYDFVQRGAQYVVENIQAIATSQINRAFADFTSQVLRELNTAGIYDSAERERILNGRITEAQRLGILPPREVGGLATYAVR